MRDSLFGADAAPLSRAWLLRKFMMKRFLFVCALASIGLAVTGCEEAKKMGADAAATAKSAAKDAAGDVAKATGVADMMSKATEALSSIEGGSAMLNNVKDSFGSLTGAVSSITDIESAKAALPKLSDVTEKFSGMTDMFGKLPATAKGAVSGVFSSALEQLKPVLEKAMAIPGVEAIVKPAIDALMEKLKSFQA
jgi:hypothetical protein